LRNNSTFLVLVASFCLSAIAYQAAQPVYIPVQHMEFDEIIIKPDMEVLEFEDYLIVAQADDADDGDTDGIDWDQHDAFWCVTHPDECNDVVIDTVDDEDYGC